VNRNQQPSQQSAQDSNKVIRCAIYTRKSTDEGLDRDFNSLDAQRESAEAYIASQKNEGWVCLPDRFDDGGFTGGNTQRPALKRLLAAVDEGQLDCIVVYKVDRLSRSLMDFSRIIEKLEKHQVSFVSVTQQFNTTHSMGRLILNILLSFAQFEREIISERTRDKMTAARKKGKWIGGIPVLGYDIDGDSRRLIINEEKAFKVRTIYELYLKRQSLLTTVRELRSRGWTNKRRTTKKGLKCGGRPFEANSLYRLLTNVLYLGKIDFRGEIIEGEHQGILDETVWQSTQEILKRNGRNHGQLLRNKYGALLKGLLYCIPCKAAMVHVCSVSNKTLKNRRYVCSQAQKAGWKSCVTKFLPAVDIERFVVDHIRSFGQNSDLIAETLNAARRQAQQNIERLEDAHQSVQLELKRLADEVTKLVASTNRSFREQEIVSEGLADLEDQMRAARHRADTLRAQITKKSGELVNPEELALAMQQFDPIWDTLSSLEQTRLLALLIERIGYDGGTGTLSITFRPIGPNTTVQESASTDSPRES